MDSVESGNLDDEDDILQKTVNKLPIFVVNLLKITGFINVD